MMKPADRLRGSRGMDLGAKVDQLVGKKKEKKTVFTNKQKA